MKDILGNLGNLRKETDFVREPREVNG